MLFYKNKLYWASLFLALIVILAILVPFYVISVNDENDRINENFDGTSRLVQSDIDTNLNNLISNLDDVAKNFGVITNYSEVDMITFEYITENIVEANYFAMSYAPIVNHTDRLNFEALLSDIYNTSIEIQYLLPNITATLSGPRDFYVPIMFTTSDNLAVIGYDLAQSFNRKAQIESALMSGEPEFANLVKGFRSGNLVNVVPLMYPIVDIYNDIVGFIATGFFVEDYFGQFSFKQRNVDYGIIMDNNVVFSSKQSTTVNDVYNDDLVNAITISVLNKNFTIVVTGGDAYKNSIISDDNELALYVGIVLFLLIISLITLLFYKNEKNDIELTNATRDSISKTYDRIVSYFSHEMRSPLNTIKSMLHYINMSEPTTDGDIEKYELTGEHMNAMFDSVHRIKHFVDEMLAFQKMADNKVIISSHQDNIIDFCLKVLKNQSLNCTSDVNLQLMVSEELVANPTVYVDGIHLSQIILNGLSNAIKFTSSGYIMIRLYSKTIDRNQYLSIEILNTGIGLGDVDIEQIFIPFSQGIGKHNMEERYTIFNYSIDKIVKQRIQNMINSKQQYNYVEQFNKPGILDNTSAFAKQEGSGMGMPISKMLSISMGGDMEIYDEYEDSKFVHTCFHSIINVTKPDSHAITIDDTVNTGNMNITHSMKVRRKYTEKFDGMQPEDISSDDIRILLIDDTISNLRTGKLIFSRLKYNIDTLDDGIHIDYDTVNKYDIILLDIVMNHSSGMEICNKLISKGYRGIILATTGHLTDDDMDMYRVQGFDGVLGKPFEFNKTDAFFKKILINKEWAILV